MSFLCTVASLKNIRKQNTRLTKYLKLLFGQKEQNMEMLNVKNKNMCTDFLTKNME